MVGGVFSCGGSEGGANRDVGDSGERRNMFSSTQLSLQDDEGMIPENHIQYICLANLDISI
jgi:hypothetical protein